MAEEAENIVLAYLRRIDEKLDRLIVDVQDLKHRVTSLVAKVASMRGDIARAHDDLSGESSIRYS